MEQDKFSRAKRDKGKFMMDALKVDTVQVELRREVNNGLDEGSPVLRRADVGRERACAGPATNREHGLDGAVLRLSNELSEKVIVVRGQRNVVRGFRTSRSAHKLMLGTQSTPKAHSPKGINQVGVFLPAHVVQSKVGGVPSGVVRSRDHVNGRVC